MISSFVPFSINLHGTMVTYDHPLVMGIINLTPDSFYSASRITDTRNLAERVTTMAADGADMIDAGAYSSRPGACEVSVHEEIRRITTGLDIIKRHCGDIPVSVDTFRAEVARAAADHGADIINDISGGTLDKDMWTTVAELKLPYILMHMRGNPATMQSLTDYTDITVEVIKYLAEKIRLLRLAGIADIIADPGFGFSKTMAQNYEIMRHLSMFQRYLDVPILIGVSRKSMITKALGITADEALNSTTVLNTIALANGASILRVHDVKEAAEAVKIFSLSTI